MEQAPDEQKIADVAQVSESARERTARPQGSLDYVRFALQRVDERLRQEYMSHWHRVEAHLARALAASKEQELVKTALDDLTSASKQIPGGSSSLSPTSGELPEVGPRLTQIDAAKLRFQRLAAEWKADVAPLSSITEMAMHPAYQGIIGMGPDALPFILEELEREPDDWFWALKAISGEDPVPPENRGNLEEMTDAWLRWADRKGYLARRCHA